MQFEQYFNDYNEMTYKERSMFIDFLVPLIPSLQVNEEPISNDLVEVFIRRKGDFYPFMRARFTKRMLKNFKKRVSLRIDAMNHEGSTTHD